MRLRRFSLTPAILFVLAAPAAARPLFAQSAKKALTVDDYSKWRAINSSSISSDGNWVTYVLLSSTLGS